MRAGSPPGKHAEPARTRGLTRLFVQIVDPANELRNLDRGDVEVDDEPLLPAARHDAMKLELITRVDLLMRDIRRHVDEVPRPRFGDELQTIAPAHSRHTVDHVDDAL